MRKRSLLSGVCLLVLLAGSVWCLPRKDNKAADTLMEQGRKVYHTHCAECHGPKGLGDGPKARELGFHPRDFALGVFKCRCTPSGQLPTADDLLRTITDGMPGTPMRPYVNLSLQDRQAVVLFIESFSPRFTSEPPPKCEDIPQPVAATEQTIFEGRQVYRTLDCWQCHGAKGRGDGPAAPGLKDDWGKPIRAYDFTVGKRLKCGGDDRDLYRTLITGMNGSPMPSYQEALLFAGDSVTDFTQYKGIFGTGELEELAGYLRRQPTASDLKAMSADAKRDLMQRRAWAVVSYLKSLLAVPSK